MKELRLTERRYYWELSARLSAANLRNEPHYWWSTIKTACGWSKRQEIPPLVQDNQLLLDEKCKADALNCFFARQCSALSTLRSPQQQVHHGEKFAFSVITTADVVKELRSLNLWEATGLDQTSARLIKECAHELAGSLTHLFNISLASERYPAQWKEALVVPVYKNRGDKCLPSSYRPISILSCASKVFGRILKKQILSYCLEHDIIPDNQLGFLPGPSTVWQLLLLVEKCQEALDAGHTVHALFLDVAKAFDRVDHDLLLLKLRAVGFAESAVKWVGSYLKGRAICTAVGSFKSELKPISSGVPQGSVLGPLLFIIFFADLPEAVKSTSTMYADDTLLYDVNCQYRDVARQSYPPEVGTECTCMVAADTSALCGWAQNNNTIFNAAKSASMVISRSRDSAVGELHLDGDTIPCCETTSHLGVRLSSRLTWSAHIESLVSKTASRITLIKWMAYRLRLPCAVISRCYLSLVRPMLEYASPVWKNCRKRDARALEKVQLQAAPAAWHGFPRLTDTDTLKQLNWPTLAWRRRLCCLLLFWKLRNHCGPPQLENMLPPVLGARTDHGLRKRLNFEVPLTRTQAHSQTFLPSTVVLWNDLPSDIQSCSSLGCFRSALCRHYSHDRFSFGLV